MCAPLRKVFVEEHPRLQVHEQRDEGQQQYRKHDHHADTHVDRPERLAYQSNFSQSVLREKHHSLGDEVHQDHERHDNVDHLRRGEGWRWGAAAQNFSTKPTLTFPFRVTCL